MATPFLTGSRVYLRALERTDLERCLGWVSDSEVTQFVLSGRFPMNLIREEEWLANQYKSETDVIFAIVIKDGERHIGNCGLHKISATDRFTELGIMIGDKDHWSKGHGTEAVAILTDYAFRVLNLNRVELSVFENNPRALRAYQKVGFKEEGRLRKRRWKNGRYLDEVLMSILVEEWKGPPA